MKETPKVCKWLAPCTARKRVGPSIDRMADHDARCERRGGEPWQKVLRRGASWTPGRQPPPLLELLLDSGGFPSPSNWVCDGGATIVNGKDAHTTFKDRDCTPQASRS